MWLFVIIYQHLEKISLLLYYNLLYIDHHVFPPISDTICDLGGASELANYGEYSGAPSEQQTYEYAKTLLGLMTKDKHPDGKTFNDFQFRKHISSS